jgi:hypothetical protein
LSKRGIISLQPTPLSHGVRGRPDIESISGQLHGRQFFLAVELVQKFHQKSSVLRSQVDDTQPSMVFRPCNFIPCH